jgi:phosphatidylinositol kinase/protein kinase (PI-3  family)
MPQYVGIADAHGLDSFINYTALQAVSVLKGDKKKVTNLIGSLQVRAYANSQRHAVVYRVTLSSEDAEIIQELYNKGEYSKALLTLKKLSKMVELEKRMEKSWNMLPNSDLDPWGGKE